MRALSSAHISSPSTITLPDVHLDAPEQWIKLLKAFLDGL